MRSSLIFTAVILAVILGNSRFGETSAQQISKYAGEETREIKSLSEDDIDQLKTGKGWGLAKAAELNGYPGPSHLLDMKSEIGMTANQEKEIRALFEDMKKRAVPLGVRLVDLERELNEAFADGKASEKDLRDVLERIGKVRSELRFVHLSAHLKTPQILTKEQVAKYNQMRGYGEGDPCKNVPAGHDPEMWKKHNGCAGQ